MSQSVNKDRSEMTAEEHLRAQLEEIKISLLDQGCRTIRDAMRRDEEAFVQMVAICLELSYGFSDEVMMIYEKMRQMNRK